MSYQCSVDTVLAQTAAPEPLRCISPSKTHQTPSMAAVRAAAHFTVCMLYAVPRYTLKCLRSSLRSCSARSAPADLCRDRQVIHWIDNTSAISCLIHGYSGKADSALLVNAFNLFNAGLKSRIHYEYVESKANTSLIFLLDRNSSFYASRSAPGRCRCTFLMRAPGVGLFGIFSVSPLARGTGPPAPAPPRNAPVCQVTLARSAPRSGPGTGLATLCERLKCLSCRPAALFPTSLPLFDLPGVDTSCTFGVLRTPSPMVPTSTG